MQTGTGSILGNAALARRVAARTTVPMGGHEGDSPQEEEEGGVEVQVPVASAEVDQDHSPGEDEGESSRDDIEESRGEDRRGSGGSTILQVLQGEVDDDLGIGRFAPREDIMSPWESSESEDGELES